MPAYWKMRHRKCISSKAFIYLSQYWLVTALSDPCSSFPVVKSNPANTQVRLIRATKNGGGGLQPLEEENLRVLFIFFGFLFRIQCSNRSVRYQTWHLNRIHIFTDASYSATCVPNQARRPLSKLPTVRRLQSLNFVGMAPIPPLILTSILEPWLQTPLSVKSQVRTGNLNVLLAVGHANFIRSGAV